MKLLLVVNPISGGVDKEPFLKNAKVILENYGINYRIFRTTGKDDEHNLKEVLDEFKPEKVASVGGDGTTLFTALALLNTNYPMGIIPQGSANGMAVELFVNLNPIEALKDIIMSSLIKGLDLLKVNEEHYTMHLGDVGINAQIVNSYENDPKRGMATYAKYFLEEMSRLAPFQTSVIANGETIKSKALMVGICNSRKYGTGVPLNTTGNPMDGKFEIVLIEKISANSLLKAGLAKFDDSFLDSQSSKVIEATNANIEFDKPRLLQLDGEVIGEFKNLKIEILPGAVSFITHGKNTHLN